MTAAVTPVILSGGSGTRLWPLSLPHRPKQLQPLFGDETMIQQTVGRVAELEAVTAPVVVCNEAQLALVVEQLEGVGASPLTVLVEPVGRNTAPAVAAAAMVLEPEVVMAVFPADHLIRDTASFTESLVRAVSEAASGALVTFGVVPDRPETGYGYIEPGGGGEVSRLVRFVEKPDEATARSYVEGGYLWNSGMFVFTAGTILEELERWVPEVVSRVGSALAGSDENRAIRRLGAAFGTAPAISLDHAVMEKTERGKVVRLDAGWSDVGSWQALWEATAAGDGTVTVGQVYARDVSGSYIRSETRPVAVVGMNNVVVVETADAVLVIDRHRAQEVRAAAEWFAALAGGD